MIAINTFVQEEKSASDMNFRFIDVSIVIGRMAVATLFAGNPFCLGIVLGNDENIDT